MIKKLILNLTVLPLLAVGSAHAAPLIMKFDTSYGGSGSAPPVGSPPWLTASFRNTCGSDCVKLTLKAGTYSSIGAAWIHSIDFNLDPSMNAASLIITPAPGNSLVVDSEVISRKTNNYGANHSGLYDIDFFFPSRGSSPNHFTAGELLTYTITGITGLKAASFDFFSAPPVASIAYANYVSSGGSRLAAAHFQKTGSLKNKNDWDSPGAGRVVPLPAAVWLMGSAVGLLGWVRRKVV